MTHQNGFSLTEVLVSLMLVSTFALALLQLQVHSRHLLNQIISDAQTSQCSELEE